MKEKVFLVRFYTKQKLVKEVKAKTFKKAADIIKTIFGEICFDYVDVVETAFTFAIKTLMETECALNVLSQGSVTNTVIVGKRLKDETKQIVSD